MAGSTLRTSTSNHCRAIAAAVAGLADTRSICATTGGSCRHCIVGLVTSTAARYPRAQDRLGHPIHVRLIHPPGSPRPRAAWHSPNRMSDSTRSGAPPRTPGPAHNRRERHDDRRSQPSRQGPHADHRLVIDGRTASTGTGSDSPRRGCHKDEPADRCQPRSHRAANGSPT